MSSNYSETPNSLNNAQPLTTEQAYELGYQRALDDFDKYYRQAYSIASDAIDALRDPDDHNKLKKELADLDERYKHARTMIGALDAPGSEAG
jgi:hypothetical protein